MEWSRSKANRVLPRECTGHSKHPLPTTQEKIYTWTSPDIQYWNQIDYILCSQRWKSSIQLAKTRPAADGGSDHEFLIAKFRHKLKKVGRTTRTFRFDLSNPLQLYNGSDKYIQGIRSDRVKNYGLRFTTLYKRQWSKPSPRKSNAKKQNGCLRRAYK